MPVAAIAFVLLAAVFHAGYNFLAKGSRDTMVFMWWTVTLGSAVYSVWLVASGLGIYLSTSSFVFFVISAVAELGYYVTLVRGYSLGDLSLVYPLSRGSAPLFVAFFSAILFAERLPLFGYAGVALMIAGVYIASLTAEGRVNGFGWSTLRAPFRNHAARWAIASAIFIAIYSISDRSAIQSTPPLVYNFWVYFGNAVSWAFLVWRPGHSARVIGELRVNWKRLLVASVMTIGAYALVLVAQTMTSTSYVVAGRGTSVVIGALLGTIVLKEGYGVERTFSALLMVAGLALIAVG